MTNKEKEIYEQELKAQKKPCPICSRPEVGKYVYHYGKCDKGGKKVDLVNVFVKEPYLINT